MISQDIRNHKAVQRAIEILRHDPATVAISGRLRRIGYPSVQFDLIRLNQNILELQIGDESIEFRTS